MRDLRTWLTSYAYWNQGGLDNVVSMFLYLARECFGLEAADNEVRPRRPARHAGGQGHAAVPAVAARLHRWLPVCLPACPPARLAARLPACQPASPAAMPLEPCCSPGR